MHDREWWKKALQCVAAVALVASFAPVQSYAAVRGVTVQDIKRGGAGAIKALKLSAEDTSGTPTNSIKGQISHNGGDWADSAISAVPYVNVSGTWQPVGGALVGADGSYSIDGLAAGTYRVGFFDSNNVYADDYYDSKTTTIGAGDDITLGGADVTGVNQTLTALPELRIAGRVHFVGATAGDGSVGVEIYSQDASGTWNVQYTVPIAADGSYKLHLANEGTYRLGFFDSDDAFAPAFYADASTVDSATDISVKAAVPVSGIDQTMTVQPSVRYGGGDAIDTAVQLSQSAFADGFGGTVVVCTGDNWPDSLAAGSYAYAAGGPILLVHQKSVPGSVIAELARLAPTEVVIVGGTSAVSVDDEMAIRGTGVPIVRRLQGNDRYGTSVAVAQEMLNRGLVLYDENGNLMNVAFATGASAADAMGGSPVAADQQMPILLVQKNKVPPVVASFLAANESSATGVLLFGGTAVVSDAVADQLAVAPASGAAADNVTRLGGTDRYATSVAIAEYATGLDFSPRMAALCSGTDYTAGLAACPVLAARKQVLLLTANKLVKQKVSGSATYTYLSPATEHYISAAANAALVPNTLARIDAIGSTAALPDDVWNYARTLAGIAH